MNKLKIFLPWKASCRPRIHCVCRWKTVKRNIYIYIHKVSVSNWIPPLTVYVLAHKEEGIKECIYIFFRFIYVRSTMANVLGNCTALVFPWGQSCKDLKLTTDLHLVPRSRMVEQYLRYNICFMAWTQQCFILICCCPAQCLMGQAAYCPTSFLKLGHYLWLGIVLVTEYHSFCKRWTSLQLT
jgi:hypothetical protein